MTRLAVQTMAQRLTVPFHHGSDTLPLTLQEGDHRAEALVLDYDFAEHMARFDTPSTPPQHLMPRYILAPRCDLVVDTLVTVHYDVLSDEGEPSRGSAVVEVAAGTLARTSFALNLGADEGPHTRLRRITMSPEPVAGMAAEWWTCTALLGNLSKLLWVIGWERDNIHQFLFSVQRQRQLSHAAGGSLDRLGADLGVPRFPPRPYAFAAGTIALYHLDETRAEGEPEIVTVYDTMARYGAAGHPGKNHGARSGAVARFGHGFEFAHPTAAIEVADHADFAVEKGDSLTVECFVWPQASWHARNEGHVLAKHANPADAGQAGWALSIGEFGRGFPCNVAFTAGDGNESIRLFADLTLSGDRFTHLAGVIDRATHQVRLYVDGILRSVATSQTLGSLTNGEPLRFGATAGLPYRGILDEVRLSRRAVTGFYPVLGEEDASYRQRLRLFKQWILPTPANLQRALNTAVGAIGGDAQPLLVTDSDASAVSASHPLAIFPDTLSAGDRIDDAGRRNGSAVEPTTISAVEQAQAPHFLRRHADSRVIYAAAPERTLAPGELPPNTRQMQTVLLRPLARLLDLIKPIGGSGKLRIESAFDPRAGDLRSVGRGLLLTHTSLSLGKLGALAHQAHFAFVAYRKADRAIYVAMPPGDLIEIESTSETTASQLPFDRTVGDTLKLSVQPALPADTFYSWFVIFATPGRARFVGPTNGATVTLEAQAPGEIMVKVEATRRRRTVSTSRVFRIGPAELADGTSIGANGAFNVVPEIADGAEPFYHPIYLVEHDDPRTAYGPGPDARRMQPQVARLLNRLLDLGGGVNEDGKRLHIIQAADPLATGIRARGRELRFTNPGMDASRLGVLAHAAGFTYVKREGNEIVVRQSPSTLLSITGPTSVAEHRSVELAIAPRAMPHTLVAAAGRLFVGNRGTSSVSQMDTTSGRVLDAYKVGRQPVALALSSDRTRLYSADSTDNTVTVLDPANGTIIARINVRNQPHSLVHHATQPRLYVACTSGAVQAIDTNDLAIIEEKTGLQPHALAVRPNGNELWVVGESSNVTVLDATTLQEMGAVTLPANAQAIAFSADGTRVYITLPTTGQLAVVGAEARTLDGVVDLGGTPHAVAVAANGTVHVTDVQSGSERVLLLDATGQPMHAVRVHRSPAVLAVDDARIYITGPNSDTISLIDPAFPAQGIVDTWALGSGLGEHINWAVRLGGASARLSSTTTPVVQVQGQQAGFAQVRANYIHAGATPAYTFEVRLKPELEQAGVVIRKEQYDLIMNILNAFHPLGVEVNTEAIRPRVVEVREGLLSAFPDYTYPNYRIQHRAARKQETILPRPN